MTATGPPLVEPWIGADDPDASDELIVFNEPGWVAPRRIDAALGGCPIRAFRGELGDDTRVSADDLRVLLPAPSATDTASVFQ